ncbi:MAG: peptidyl-prolyl cis-trans isomerase, partial [Chloroflexota bacterium]|nr:peptidyl-prolyl cis-trans isomerase [Chloroflexota bacterium]
APAETNPDASPAASPSVSPTPNPTEAVQTAEAGYSTYRDSVFETARISRAGYEEWVARPQLVRQRVTDILRGEVGQRGEQVRAAHILVGTQELAQQLRLQLDQPGSSFADIASTQSTDTASAANGGDLGWFTFGELVPPFEETAFGVPPGQISQPVQTEFGWHIIRVDEHVLDRPFSDEQITALQDRAVQRWLDEKKAGADIDSEVDPTATTVTSVFQPPAGAPAPPSPTEPVAPVPDGPSPTLAPLPRPPG